MTSAGAGPSLGKYLLMAYLPPEQAVEGSDALAVEYMNERFPVTVAVVGATALVRSRECEDPLVKILVCVKRVPMTGGRIVLTEDELAIETKHLGFAISPHEECGVEEAVRLVEQHGGESVVLTLGPADAEEQLRDAMAIGIDRGIHLVTDGEEWDPEATAGAIVEAIRADEAASGPFDLDLLRQRVGRLRRLPGRPPCRATRSAAPARPGSRASSSRARACGASRRSAAAATSTSCRCPPS